VSVDRWLRERMSPERWRLVGFNRPPAPKTVGDRFKELDERCQGVLATSSGFLIRRADRRTDGLVSLFLSTT
jgi:hypothetical protein